MKILHLCLASFYIDNYSYQENLLPKYHKKMGLDVEIIASLYTFDTNGEGTYIEEPSSYINEHDIPVTRLNYRNNKLGKMFRTYKGTYNAIVKSKPDIIFIHGCQFLDIKQVAKYASNNPQVKIYVDNHADFSNSATNWLSKNILHKKIWKSCANLISPYTTKFYGVLPARVDFLKNIYGISQEQIDLLVMGVDDEKLEKVNSAANLHNIREKYQIKPNDFLIVTGGKIDGAKKQTLLLLEAVKQIKDDSVKLIVFGSVTEELEPEIKKYVDDSRIKYIGWIDSNDSYNYFSAADLVVFPGRHSVFWEQVVGLGKPAVFKYWEGTTHVDIGGNCKFLYHDSVNEILNLLMDLINNRDELDKMRDIAEAKGMEYFSYDKISRRSINL